MSLITPAAPWPTPEQLAILRVRIGLLSSDTSRDAELTTAWNIATAWIEAYLDRYLIPGTYGETFTHTARHVVSLKAYPVTAIASLMGDTGAEVVAYHLEKQNGLIHFDGFVINHEMTVEYDATPEVDGPLLLALLGAFDVAWSSLGATSPDTGTAPVKALSSNGARVEFDLSAGGLAVESSSGLPLSVTYLLNAYRRESC